MPPVSLRYVNLVSKPLDPIAVKKIVVMRDRESAGRSIQAGALHFRWDCANHAPKQREPIQLGKLTTGTKSEVLKLAIHE
jgi:hypothetical protein